MASAAAAAIAELLSAAALTTAASSNATDQAATTTAQNSNMNGTSTASSSFGSASASLVSLLASYFFGPAASLLLQNQVFSGGLAITVLFLFFDWARNYLRDLYNYLLALNYVSISINEREECYELVSEWLYGRLNGDMKGQHVERLTSDTSKTAFVSRHDIRSGTAVRRLQTKSIWKDKYSEDPFYDQRLDTAEGRRPRLVFVPDRGDYDLIVDGRRVHVSCGSSGLASGEMGRDGSSQKKPESIITLTTWSPAGDHSLLRSIVKQAVDEGYNTSRDQTLIYAAYFDRWRRISAREPRSFDSVILKTGVKEELVKDIKTFMESASWYKACGVPYRRGILLYGPPGCGKSSIILALAGHLKLSVCLISLSSPAMSDQTLNELLVTSPPQSILLLEDIDAAFPASDDAPSDKSSKPNPEFGQAMRAGNGSSVTLSGLLNAVDGIAAQEGSIVVMTTNHPERLPPALLRPGRIDKKLLFDKADKDQVRRMFLKFFPDKSYPDQDVEGLAVTVSEKIEEGSLTTAQLQGLFMGYRLGGPVKLVEELDKWLAEQAEEEAKLAKIAEENKKKAARAAGKEDKKDNNKKKSKKEAKVDSSDEDESGSRSSGSESEKEVTVEVVKDTASDAGSDSATIGDGRATPTKLDDEKDKA